MKYRSSAARKMSHYYPYVRKTPSLQGGDISTNLLILNIFFDHIQGCSPA